MDVGVRIAGRQNVVYTVAARAVRNLLHAPAGSQAMEAVLIGRDLVSVKTVFLTKP
jgi:hypothetical protein